MYLRAIAALYSFLLDIQVVSEVLYYWTALLLPGKGNYSTKPCKRGC